MRAYKDLFGVKKFNHLIFSFTNVCNLHCEHCSVLCDIPLDKHNLLIHRRQRYVMDSDEAELFCERFVGIGENDWHRLTGGEPTIFHEHLEEVLEVFHNHNRKTCFISNGYNLMGMDKNVLKKVGKVVLDDHGINKMIIRECKKWLKTFYTGIIQHDKVLYHADLEKAKNHHKNNGSCEFWLKAPLIEKRVIYPCCPFPGIELYDNHTNITKALIQSGWTIDNPHIVYTVEHWMETLPRIIMDECHHNCWRPDVSLGGMDRITLKEDDVLCKMD